jgi:hypothetical protein
MTTTDLPVLPPPFEDLHWADFPGYFNHRSMRRVHIYLDEIQFASLRQQEYILADTLCNNMQIQITYVEISTLFGHSGGWAQGMIARHFHSAHSENPTLRGRLRAIDSDKKFIQFCSVRRSEKNPVTVQDAVDCMHDNRAQVDK